MNANLVRYQNLMVNLLNEKCEFHFYEAKERAREELDYEFNHRFFMQAGDQMLKDAVITADSGNDFSSRRTFSFCETA